MELSEIERASQQLLDARRYTRLLERSAIAGGDYSVDDAYRIARANVDALMAAGERPAGRKIGFTNRGIWEQYKVYQPIWAHVYASTVQYFGADDRTIAASRFCQPRIEPEIVLKFARAPEIADPHAIAECLEWVAHGFEIVDCHFAHWKFVAAETIADFGLHGALLIGEPVLLAQIPSPVETLSSFAIALSRDGEVVDRGKGSNVLDSPLHAVAHLMRVLEDQSLFSPLAAGEVITTGTLTAAWPIVRGQFWDTKLDGIGVPGLSVRFT